MFTWAHAQIAPDCTYDGRWFSGAADDYEDIASVCSSTFGGAFSVAFTVTWSNPLVDGSRIFDFGTGPNGDNILVSYQNGNRLWTTIVQSNGQHSTASTSVVVQVGTPQRFLFSLSDTGHFQGFLEGVNILDESGKPMPATTNRMLYIAKSHWSEPNFRGTIRDFSPWHQEVDWTSAAMTTTTTTLAQVAPAFTYAGREFGGAAYDFEDLSSAYSNAFGGAFSVAWTSTWPSLVVGSRIFDFGNGPGSDNIVVSVATNSNLRMTIIKNNVESFAETPAVLQVGTPQRFLFSLSNTGYLQVFLEGVKVLDKRLFVPTTISRTLYLAKSHWGEPNSVGSIYDFRFWLQEVDWTSIAMTLTTTTLANSEPTCTYAGREFSGADDDFEDLSSVCSNTFGGAFSVAWTVIWSPPLLEGERIFDFGNGPDGDNIMISYFRDNKLYTTIVLNGVQEPNYISETSAVVQLGTPQRFLFSLSDTGHFQGFLEGVKIMEVWNRPMPATTSRTLYIGKSHWGLGVNKNFKGAIYDFWWWHQEVDWNSAVITTTTSTTTTTTMAKVGPGFTYFGRAFSGAAGDFEDLSNVYSNTFGGAFSVAFTVTWSNPLVAGSRIFDFGTGPNGDNILVAYAGDNKLQMTIENGGQSTASTSAVVQVGTPQRFLFSLSDTGHLQGFLAGVKVLDEENLKVPATTSRTLYLAKSHAGEPNFKGTITDFSIWHQVVDWQSTDITATSTPTSTTLPSTTTEMVVVTSIATAGATTVAESMSGIATSTGRAATPPETTIAITDDSIATTANVVTTDGDVTAVPAAAASTATSTTTVNVATTDRAVTAVPTTAASTTTMISITGDSFATTASDVATTESAVTAEPTTAASAATSTMISITGESFATTASDAATTDSAVTAEPTTAASAATSDSSTTATISITGDSFATTANDVATTSSAVTAVPSTAASTATSTTISIAATNAVMVTTAVHTSTTKTWITSDVPAMTTIATTSVGMHSWSTTSRSSSTGSTVMGTATTTTTITALTNASTRPSDITARITPFAASSTKVTLTSTTRSSTRHPWLPQRSMASTTTAIAAAAAEGNTLSTTFTETSLPLLQLNAKEAPVPVVNFLRGAEELRTQLFISIADSNDTTAAKPLHSGGIMSVSKLSTFAEMPRENAANTTIWSTKTLEIHVPQEVAVRVALPLNLLAAIADEGEDVALAVTRLSPEVFAGVGGAEESGIKVAAAASIDLFRNSSTRPSGTLNVTDLQQPTEFRLPINFSVGMLCAYFDEVLLAWSTGGVETSPKNVEGEHIYCKTYHLTIFGAIFQEALRTLECANFGLLNADAFKQLFSGSWQKGTGFTIAMLLLGLFALAFMLAAWQDHKGSQHWRSEFLLLAVGSDHSAQSADVVGDASQLGSPSEERHKGMLVSVCLGVAGCLRYLRESSMLMDTLLEAVDEICSTWFEFFGEVRSILQSLWQSLQIDGAWAMTDFRQLSQVAAVHMIIQTSRRRAASSLGLTDDTISFVMSDEDLHRFIVQELNRDPHAFRSAPSFERACSSCASQQDREFAVRQREAWISLHRGVSDSLMNQAVSESWRSSPGDVFRLFWRNVPLGASVQLSIFQSAKQRLLLLAAEASGALAISCAFFEAGGMIKKRGAADGASSGYNCGDDDTGMSVGIIGRLIVIGTASFLLASLPVTILESLITRSGIKLLDFRGSKAWKRQLMVWRTQEFLFWVCGTAYITTTSLYILVFLANIGDEDDQDWAVTAIIAILQDFAAIPFLVSAGIPCFVALSTVIHRALGGSTSGLLRRAQVRLSNATMLPIMSV